MKLLFEEGEKLFVKDIKIFDDPETIKPLLNSVRWRILGMLAEKPMYPGELAKTMKMHEQKVYYHVKQLSNAGLITIVKKKEFKGALAKYYQTSFPAFGVQLPFGKKRLSNVFLNKENEKLSNFFRSFIKDDELNAKIVVGSPDPHGPFKAHARDGHYAIDLAMFLGQLCKLPKDFSVKLDVDLIAEKEEKNNLIVVGGPVTNRVTAMLNDYLPVKFVGKDWAWGIQTSKGDIRREDKAGFITRVKNPWDESKRVIVIAGNRVIGTKSAVIGLTRNYDRVLRNFDKQDSWSCVVEGFDMSGNGKVDTVEVLEAG
ncbi:MAG: helix-turn-helix domain-containing protein [Nanoarchaeota archaeon]|nr:helix-turn-helix domain-containing protein [Nanoarchaeota archaeon]